jgi:hypothetical protein
LQLELEHLISWEAPRGAILSGAAGTDVPSLHGFLEILLGNAPEYSSNNAGYYSPSCECFYLDGEVPADDALELHTSKFVLLSRRF